MRKEFLNGASNKEEKVVKAFIESPTNAENALKTKPKVSTKSCFETCNLIHKVALLFVLRAVWTVPRTQSPQISITVEMVLVCITLRRHEKRGTSENTDVGRRVAIPSPVRRPSTKQADGADSLRG